MRGSQAATTQQGPGGRGGGVSSQAAYPPISPLAVLRQVLPAGACGASLFASAFRVKVEQWLQRYQCKNGLHWPLTAVCARMLTHARPVPPLQIHPLENGTSL